MDLLRGSRQMLESLARAGVSSLPRAAVPGATGVEPTQHVSPQHAPPQHAPPQPAGPAPVAPHVGLTARRSPGLPLDTDGDAMPASQRPAALEVIAAKVAGCTLCAELVANRTRTVFGVGNPSARLCFMGKAHRGR